MKHLNKLLFILFLLLTAAAVYYIWRSSNPTRTFKENLAQIDTAKVNKVIIMAPKGDDKGYTTVTLQRKGDAWQLEADSLNGVAAEKQAINTILQTILDLQKTKRMVSNTPEKQAEYKVSNTSGALHLQVFEKEEAEPAMDIYLGKLAVQQPTNTAAAQDNDPQAAMAAGRRQQPIFNTYVRLEDENDIYVVDGMPAMILNRPAQDFLPRQAQTLPDSTTLPAATRQK